MSRAILGAVLAGGRSRRMGRDKALLPVAGQPLIRRVAGVLGEVCDEVVVVGRRPGELPALGLPVLADRLPGRGPLGGLDAALAHAEGRFTAVFLAACDLPGLTAELVRHLVAAAGPLAGPSARTGAWAVVPVAGGRPHPLCGLYATACREPLADSLAAGELGATRFLERIDTLTVAVTPELSFYRGDLLTNLNRPGDYESWLAAREERP